MFYQSLSGNDELLSSIGKLASEYGKIGSNLIQIARSLNEYGAPYPENTVRMTVIINDSIRRKY